MITNNPFSPLVFEPPLQGLDSPVNLLSFLKKLLHPITLKILTITIASGLWSFVKTICYIIFLIMLLFKTVAVIFNTLTSLRVKLHPLLSLPKFLRRRPISHLVFLRTKEVCGFVSQIVVGLTNFWKGSWEVFLIRIFVLKFQVAWESLCLI